MGERTIHLLLKGRVQGVGFRWFVADEARRLGLAGWVRNNRDGSVELCAQGDEKALATLRQAAEKGPSGATVSAVESLGSAPAGKMSTPFSIARE